MGVAERPQAGERGDRERRGRRGQTGAPGVADGGAAAVCGGVRAINDLIVGASAPRAARETARGRRAALLCGANNQSSPVMCQVRHEVHRQAAVRSVPSLRAASARARRRARRRRPAREPVARDVRARGGSRARAAVHRARAVAPPREVVVVGISRDSARALGQTTELDTWPRDLHAQLVDRLTAAGASAIAFDLMFHEPRDGPGDALFAASIERAGNVLLLEETRERGRAARRQRRRLARDAHAAAAGAEGGRARLGAVHPADGAGARRAVVDVRSRHATTRRRCRSLALQAHLLPYYEEFVRLLERARPGSTREWPQTRAAVQEQRNLELTMGAIRRAFQSDAALRAAARRELERGELPAATARALEVLLDLYAGASSRYPEFLWAGARDPDGAVRPRARRVRRDRPRRQGRARRAVRAAAAASSRTTFIRCSRRTPAST